MDGSPPLPAAVLIIEDHAEVRDTLAEILEAAGYPASTAANGREAIEYLCAHPAPGLILLDLMMPVMNGWDFRAAQQQDARLAQIPVVILSGSDRLPDTALALQVPDYLGKPLHVDRLLEMVARYVDQRAD